MWTIVHNDKSTKMWTIVHGHKSEKLWTSSLFDESITVVSLWAG